MKTKTALIKITISLLFISLYNCQESLYDSCDIKWKDEQLWINYSNDTDVKFNYTICNDEDGVQFLDGKLMTLLATYLSNKKIECRSTVCNPSIINDIIKENYIYNNSDDWDKLNLSSIEEYDSDISSDLQKYLDANFILTSCDGIEGNKCYLINSISEGFIYGYDNRGEAVKISIDVIKTYRGWQILSELLFLQ